jgi:hypothetical protein
MLFKLFLTRRPFAKIVGAWLISGTAEIRSDKMILSLL